MGWPRAAHAQTLLPWVLKNIKRNIDSWITNPRRGGPPGGELCYSAVLQSPVPSGAFRACVAATLHALMASQLREPLNVRSMVIKNAGRHSGPRRTNRLATSSRLYVG